MPVVWQPYMLALAVPAARHTVLAVIFVAALAATQSASKKKQKSSVILQFAADATGVAHAPPCPASSLVSLPHWWQTRLPMSFSLKDAVNMLAVKQGL